MSPKIWGRQAWHFIHCVALSYPVNPTEKDKEKYLAFFKSLVLPCPACLDHFKQNMEKTRPNLESKQTLFNWTVDIHNSINAEHNKQIFSYDEAAAEIEANVNKDIRTTIGIAASVSITAMLIVASYWLAKKK
jgi:hypothetical protein